MKVIKILILAAILSLGVNSVAAQAKLGHLHVPLLISLMPETKKADAQLETMAKGFEADYTKMATEYQNLMQKYSNEAAKQSEAMNQTRSKEMQDRAARIQTFQESAQSELEKKRNELYAPIFKKAQDAIDAISKEKGLIYVFDSSKGVIIYDGGGIDIIEPVKKKLGIQ
ncbi:MAG: OmpH family outer membrane protein [Flavobacteriales bacterium]|nr:OmpH family outer membrane protein [Flavobacteriales bacterium]